MSSDSASEKGDWEHVVLSQATFESDPESDSLDNVTSRKRRKLSTGSTQTEAVSSFSVNVPSRVKSKTATVQVPEAVPTPVTVAETEVAVHGHASSSFQDLNLKPWLTQSLKNMAIHRPTRIQYLTIPAILEGRDVIGSSRTGSGKTGQSEYSTPDNPDDQFFSHKRSGLYGSDSSTLVSRPELNICCRSYRHKRTCSANSATGQSHRRSEVPKDTPHHRRGRHAPTSDRTRAASTHCDSDSWPPS